MDGIQGPEQDHGQGSSDVQNLSRHVEGVHPTEHGARLLGDLGLVGSHVQHAGERSADLDGREV